MDRDVLVGLIELQKHPQQSGSSEKDKRLSDKLEKQRQAYFAHIENKLHYTDAYHVGWFTEEGAGHAEDRLTAFHCDDGWLEEPIKKKEDE